MAESDGLETAPLEDTEDAKEFGDGAQLLGKWTVFCGELPELVPLSVGVCALGGCINDDLKILLVFGAGGQMDGGDGG